jgi:acetate kinase
MNNKNILIFNCGSSSLSYKLFSYDGEALSSIAHGKAHRVGVVGSESSFVEHCSREDVKKQTLPIKDHSVAANLVLDHLAANAIRVDCIGHRFVHGGNKFKAAALVNDLVMEKLIECVPLAPLHNLIALKVISRCKIRFPEVSQAVVFDSAFHLTIPSHAYTYALPRALAEKFGFRKFGFHGISYSYVSRKALDFLGLAGHGSKIVACHLGTGGSSVAAIRDGRSIDTSMGYSPLSGLVMSTRSGDIDPMLTMYLMATCGYKAQAVIDMLNKESGLLGISGFTSDIRDIIEKRSMGQGNSGLAFEMYVHRIKKYIGSYAAVMEGIDALIFTDDIGVNSPLVREKVCEAMEWCGVSIDTEKNKLVSVNNITVLSAESSRCKVLCVPTDEEIVICEEVIKTIYEKKHIADRP